MKSISSIIAVITTTIILTIGSGCEPELVTSIPLPTEDPKLAVSAFLIAGDTVHVVFLGKSQPNHVSGFHNPFVGNGTVQILRGTDTLDLINLGDGLYGFTSAMMQVQPGATYQLIARAPGFEIPIRAECTIPEVFDPQFEYKSIQPGKPNDWGVPYDVEISFKDVAGSKDFYRVFAHAVVERETSWGMTDTIRMMMYSPESQPQLIKDEGKDGQKIPLKMKFELSNYEGETFKLLYLDFAILRTDEAYYKFNYPFVVQGYYDDNPFGEPTVIYTNVTNGYGVLAGAVRWQTRISI